MSALSGSDCTDMRSWILHEARKDALDPSRLGLAPDFFDETWKQIERHRTTSTNANAKGDPPTQV